MKERALSRAEFKLMDFRAQAPARKNRGHLAGARARTFSLLLRQRNFADDAEAGLDVAEVRVERIAISGAAQKRCLQKTAAACDAHGVFSAGRGPLWVVRGAAVVIGGGPVVGAHFFDIPMHVVEPEGVRFLFANRMRDQQSRRLALDLK